MANAKGTDLVPAAKYAMAKQPDLGSLISTINANLGGQKLDEFSLDRIVIPGAGGKVWNVPTLEGDVQQAELEGIIVFWKPTRGYWIESYEQSGGGSPPDCSSRNASVARSRDGFNPGAKTDDEGRFICESCPLAQWGSADNDTQAQACKLVWQVFLLTPNDLLPMVVSLPPTSTGEAQKFFLRITRAGLPYFGVITKIGLEQDKSTKGIVYSKATFSVGERLSDEERDRVEQYANALKPHFEALEIADVEAEAVEVPEAA